MVPKVDQKHIPKIMTGYPYLDLEQKPKKVPRKQCPIPLLVNQCTNFTGNQSHMLMQGEPKLWE